MKKRILVLISALVLLLSSSVPVFAAGEAPIFEDGTYVHDPYGYMSESETADLEARAAYLSETYQCGMYIAVVDDMFAYADYVTYDALEASKEIYRNYGLGIGADKTGTLLILSMDERDYALIAYGDFAHKAFTDYGKECLTDIFLNEFANDWWYDGFDGYLEKCQQMLEMAAEGNYFDVDTDPDMKSAGIVLALGVILASAVIALIVCGIISSSMQSVGFQRSAATYIRKDSLRLGRKIDMYTHTTETRERIDNDNDSSSGSRGGTSVGSDGFSGSSGKF